MLSLHRCKVCGTRWLLWPDAIHGGGWNLLDKYSRPGSCCDNAAMGEQIEHLRDFDLTVLRACASPDDRREEQDLSGILQSVLQMIGLPGFNNAWFDEHGDWDFGKLREHGLDAKLAEIRAALRACAEALAPAPDNAEEAVIEHIVSHWFTQGGQAQFGELDLPAINADGLVSAILTNVRGKLVADALAPAPAITDRPREATSIADLEKLLKEDAVDVEILPDGTVRQTHRADALAPPEPPGLTPELDQEIDMMLRLLNGTATGNYGEFSRHAKLAYDMIHELRLKLKFPQRLAPPEPGWQPNRMPTFGEWLEIETAPRDGTTVLGYTPNECCLMGDVFWHTTLEQWCRLPDLDRKISPTHWTFPAPPRADALDAKESK